MGVRSILKLAGKGEVKIAAVFGFTPESCHRAVTHVRSGAPDIPVWLFATTEPPPETAAHCNFVLVRSSQLALAADAWRLLWPYWVALSVAPWTGGFGGWPLKLVAFSIPPFRVLVQNKHGGFFPATPAAILRHWGRIVRDGADGIWNALRTWSHAVGDVRRDIGNYLENGDLRALSTLLVWIGRPHYRLFRKLHGQERLEILSPPASGEGVMIFRSEGPRWDGESIERLLRESDARWLFWTRSAADPPPDLILPFEDPRIFAVSRQTHFRAWKPTLLPAAPFRTLQPGEWSQVLAPISDEMLIDRGKLLALGIPRTSLSGTAWMELFWKAAAAGWRSYSAGQERPLTEQPDFPMQETAFAWRMLTDSRLRRLGPREPELARGSIAWGRQSCLPPAFQPARRLKGGGSQDWLPHILLVTPFLPYPLSHGGAVRIYNLCSALKDRVDFSLVALREKHDVVDYEKLHEIFSEVHVVDIDERASNDEGLPSQVRGHQSRAMAALISAILERRRPDLLQVEYTHLAALREAVPDVPALLVEHDVTYTLYRQLATSRPSAEAEAEYRRWFDFECRWLREYEGVWTVSEEDRRLVSEDAKQAFAVPNGVDVDRFRPSAEAWKHQEILYVGSFRHLPNILGFEKLRTEVMPRVWSRFPAARLRVVAGPRYEEYWKGRGALDPRIAIHGFVEDLRPLYAGANVVAVPLEVSAGTNIKVLEAMASGRAVVSTPVGCAGLGLVDGADAVIRDRWEEFAEAACDLLADHALRNRIAAAGRRTTEQRFSWGSIADAAFESYRTLARRGELHSTAS